MTDRPVDGPALPETPFSGGAGGTPAPASSLSIIDGWLNLMLRLSRLPAAEARDVREELEEHLEQRTRDFLIEGHTEMAAARLAITELGDAAVVASRFRHTTNQTTRRRIMNIILGGLAVTGVALGLIAVSQERSQAPGDIAVYSPANTSDAEGPMIPPGNFENEPLREVIRIVDETIPQEIIVDWPSLVAAGLSEEAPITLRLTRPTPLSVVFTRLSKAAPGIDWRLADDTVEVSSRDAFDRSESRLSSFDITDVIDHVRNYENETYDDAVKSIIDLICASVEPESWQHNGGDTAQLHVVGGRMFIKAPARFNEPIQWILSQLRPKASADAGRDFQLERLQLEQETAQKSYDRGQTLYSRGLLSQTELQELEHNLKVANLNVEAHGAPIVNGVPLIGWRSGQNDPIQATSNEPAAAQP